MLGNILAAFVLAIFGFALLANGYVWFRLLLPIWAFFVGTAAITALFANIFGQGLLVTTLACVPAILVGLVFAVLSYVWWSIAVLFWAGTIGFALFAGLLTALGINGWLIVWLFGVVGAFVFIGIASRNEFRKFVPIFLTAGAGATMLLTAVLVLFGKPLEQMDWGTFYGPLANGATSSFLAIVIWIVLTGIGIGIQSATNKSLEVQMERYATANASGAVR